MGNDTSGSFVRIGSPSVSSVDLISKSRHSEVYLCRYARPRLEQSGGICLKFFYTNEIHLRYQANVLKRIHECRGISVDGYGMPPVLSYGMGTLPRGTLSHDMGLLSCVATESSFRKDRTKYPRPRLAIATPWIEGVTLARLLANSRTFPFASLGNVLALLDSIARCIERLSSMVPGTTFVHQDIKPSNIVVKQGSLADVVIIDYDTAVLLDDLNDIVPSGSYEYAAPESVLGRGSCATATSDIFSFGLLACELLSGVRPYPSGLYLSNDDSVWRAYFRSGGAPHIDGAIPRDVRLLLESCLSFNWVDRPFSSELVVEMRSLVGRYANSDQHCLIPICSLPTEPPTPFWDE